MSLICKTKPTGPELEEVAYNGGLLLKIPVMSLFDPAENPASHPSPEEDLLRGCILITKNSFLSDFYRCGLYTKLTFIRSSHCEL
jgi:hypothetical protein